MQKGSYQLYLQKTSVVIKCVNNQQEINVMH